MTQDPSKLMFLSGTLRTRPQKGGYPYMGLLQAGLCQLGISPGGGGGGGVIDSGSGLYSSLRICSGNIASGESSTALGVQNTSGGFFSSITGGLSNLNCARAGFIGGGLWNTINPTYSGYVPNNGLGSVIAGGIGNNTTGGVWDPISNNFTVLPTRTTCSGRYSFIGAGFQNINEARGGFIGAGHANSVSGYYTNIVGGGYNTSNSDSSFIGAGNYNSSSGYASSIVGGTGNTASGYLSIVGGGYNNVAALNHSFIGGGGNNVVNGSFGAINGGSNNTVSNGYGYVGGGQFNNAFECYSTVSGGYSNSTCGCYSTIGGGYNNIIAFGTGINSVIGGGYRNIVESATSGILGGQNNSTIHNNAFIVGSDITSRLACATHVNRLVITQIPTSTAGLPSGAVWRSGNALQIVP